MRIKTITVSKCTAAELQLWFEMVSLPKFKECPPAAYVTLNGSNEYAAIEQATKNASPTPRERGMRFVVIDDNTNEFWIVSAFKQGQMIFTIYGQTNDISIMVPCTTLTEWSQKIMTAIDAVRANIDITEEEVEELIK